MSLLAVVGDCTTTTTLAVAAGWTDGDQVVVIEGDPRGGSLAAWLDVPPSPSLSTVVATLRTEGDVPDPEAWALVEPLVRRASSGTRFIPAPFRAREATHAVAEAGRRLLPLVAGRSDVVAIVDLGRPHLVDPDPGGGAHTALDRSAAVLLCHRQEPSSAAAASVRLERLAECVDALHTPRRPIVVALIGDRPYGANEVADFVGRGVRVRAVAPDPLAAAVLAGRRGVSTRRLARLPLLRTARAVADELRPLTHPTPPGGRRGARS